MSTPLEQDLIQDLYLRCRPPQSKEELFWYCKEQLRVACEACKGAGSYWVGPTRITCEWCAGKGSHGFHIARTSVCPGHAAPLDVLWDLWAGNLKQVLVIATRGGGKTRLTAIIEHLKARFQRYSISHMGAIEQQALRCRGWLRQQLAPLPETPPFLYDPETKEPMLPGSGPGLPELDKDSQELVEWSNGGSIEFLPGTMAQASGPHRELSVLDEVDEADPDVQQKFSKTPTGPRAMFLMTSTHTYATGTVSRIKREQPTLPIRVWCLLESLAKCDYDCNKVPMPDGTKGKCPLFEEEVNTVDGRREIRPLCGGVLARKADGHMPLPQAILNWTSSSPYTRGVELLCRNPEFGMGAGLAYWAYAPQNLLQFNPYPRSDAPIEWAMDFNPGMTSEMCSLVIQQAPAPFENEWWVIDEIILPTSSTTASVEEFLRRYGPNGVMLNPDLAAKGHWGGTWIYGDATGHARKSTTGETDYEVVFKLLDGKMNNLRILIQPGDSNPPLVDRLNRSNEVLWDPVSKKRTLKVAPRVERFRDELARMPLKIGTREKDKSQKIQRLGLSHLGDCYEYWVWLRFPGGIGQGAASEQMIMGKKRDTGELVIMGAGRGRDSANYAGRDPAVGLMAPPWAGSVRSSHQED